MLVQNKCILCRQCKQYSKQKYYKNIDNVFVRFRAVSTNVFAKDFITKYLFDVIQIEINIMQAGMGYLHYNTNSLFELHMN